MNGLTSKSSASDGAEGRAKRLREAHRKRVAANKSCNKRYEPPTAPSSRHPPHQGQRERDRRARQIEAGKLTGAGIERP